MDSDGIILLCSSECAHLVDEAAHSWACRQHNYHIRKQHEVPLFFFLKKKGINITTHMHRKHVSYYYYYI